MKTTRIFAAAIALLSVLSCQKEEQQAINNSEIEGVNLITCTFAANDAATKTTTTDGKTPLWAAGDKIMLYDGSSNTQELTLAASGEPSSSQGIIDGTNATKFTFAKPDGWTNVYAIYPSSACVTEFSASAPKLNFAGQDGTFAKANICAAAEISGTMFFQNVGAILKFPSKPTTVTAILIPVAGLAKDYTVSFSGVTPSLTPVDATNTKSYSIGSGTETIYIGVPAENLAAGMNFIYQDSNKDILGSYTTVSANSIEKNKIYTLSAIAANGTIPAGMLSKAFSVSSTEKVYFSKGNLQATVDNSGTPSAWNFAANQYGYIGKNVANNSIGTGAGVVDLFGWSTDATSNNWGIHTKTSATADWTDGNFKDWGANAIANGGNTANQWSTLSSTEWSYLLNTSGSSGRTDANRFAKAMVNSMEGLIIFPDGYNGGTKISDGSITGVAKVNTTDAGYPDNSIAAAIWSTMESAGCVFLPAAGSREGSDVKKGGNYGYYWSSTPSVTDYTYRLRFQIDQVNPASNGSCYIGISVRLVCAAQ